MTAILIDLVINFDNHTVVKLLGLIRNQVELKQLQQAFDDMYAVLGL